MENKDSLSKRRFLQLGMLGLAGLILKPKFNDLFANNKNTVMNDLSSSNPPAWKWSKEAMFYSVTARGVKCEVCPNYCQIKPNEKGLCKSKVNEKNKLLTIAYGNPCSVNIDPVEKKPLYHFLPQTRSYSIAAAGCTFACLNCQNWEISQVGPDETINQEMFPQKVVDNAVSGKCKSIAYTYSEPISFFEYTYDTAKLARAKGIKNLLISNGYINEKPLRELCKYMDAANINLKSFDDTIYQKLNGGSLQPVLNTLKIMKEMNVWLEITNLVVPTWTDKQDMIQKMCDWLVKNGFQNYPLHFIRFFPIYKLQHLQSTPVTVLEKARNTALKAGMKYVYVGNVPEHEGNHTYCPKCKKKLIERKGFMVTSNNIVKNACKFCGEKIHGIWA